MATDKQLLIEALGGKAFWDTCEMVQVSLKKNDNGEEEITKISFNRNNATYKMVGSMEEPTLFIGNKQSFTIPVNKTFQQRLNQETVPVYVAKNIFEAVALSDSGCQNIVLLPTKVAGELQFAGKGRNEEFISLGYDEALQNTLRKQGVFYQWLPDDDYLDLYKNNPSRFSEVIKDRSLLKNCKELKDSRTAEQEFDGFYEELLLENLNTTPTGFTLLDKGLDGGLKPGLYTIGAMSAAGKTTFIHQIADQIAGRMGKTVYYLNLEMRRHDMYKKSIKRQGFINSLREGKTDYFKANEMLNNDKKAIVEQAIKDTKETHKNVIFTNLDVSIANVDDFIAEIKTNIADLNVRPVVIVDYLQIMKSAKNYDNDKDRISECVSKLKRLSDDFDLTIIVISSLNRANYKNSTGLEAFKGSGDIEYSSDFVFALEFEGQDNKDFDYDKAKQNDPRKMVLRLLKSRFLYMPPLHLEYYPQYDCFFEINPDENNSYKSNGFLLSKGIDYQTYKNAQLKYDTVADDLLQNYLPDKKLIQSSGKDPVGTNDGMENNINDFKEEYPHPNINDDVDVEDDEPTSEKEETVETPKEEVKTNKNFESVNNEDFGLCEVDETVISQEQNEQNEPKEEKSKDVDESGEINFTF